PALSPSTDLRPARVSGLLDSVWNLGMKNAHLRMPVDFWFDPVCPWTWLTSRWILEDEKARPLAITWHVLSLAVLNEGRLDQVSEAHRELMRLAWAAVRIRNEAAQTRGPDVLGPLYTALGPRYFPQGQPKTRPTIEA